MNFPIRAYVKLLRSNKIADQDFSEECQTEKSLSYFSTKTYIVGTQKNCLNEAVLLSTENV